MDISAIKQRLNSLQSNSNTGKKEKIDYTKVLWKPKEEGKYQIRFVPSKLNSKNPFQEIFVHYRFAKFPIFALNNWGEKDPIIEFASQLRKTSDKENWSLAKKLDPKMRIYAPVIVRGEEEKGVRLWEFGKEIYMQLLGIADDEDYGDYTNIHEGRDFTVEAIKGDIGGRIGLKCSIRIKPKTTALHSDSSLVQTFLNEQPNILEIQRKMSFEDVKTILQNWLSPETEDGEVEEAEEEIIEKTPVKNYALKDSTPTKATKADKFDALFDDEESNSLPFDVE